MLCKKKFHSGQLPCRHLLVLLISVLVLGDESAIDVFFAFEQRDLIIPLAGESES